MNIELRPLDKSEEEIFVRENQIAFDKAAVEEFGPQEESVIPREDIISSIHAENAQAFRIIVDGEPVGGVVVAIHSPGDSRQFTVSSVCQPGLPQSRDRADSLAADRGEISGSESLGDAHALF